MLNADAQFFAAEARPAKDALAMRLTGEVVYRREAERAAPSNGDG